MSPHFILLYTATVLIASIIPGPSMLLALTHGMQYGIKKTTASALGNVIVTLVQAMVSIAGLGTVLMASQTLFHLVKWAGAGYLVYIGVRMFFAPGMAAGNEYQQVKRTVPARKMFLQGALVTAGNPKAIVFFTAVFPQFLDPGKGYLVQSFFLLTIIAPIAFGCFMIYAACGKQIISMFSGAGIGKACNRIIGSTFIGAGIGLAVSDN